MATNYHKNFAPRISLIYLAVSLVWIIATDIFFVSGTQFSFFRVEVIKGCLFVTLTAALLYYLIHRGFVELSKSEEKYRYLVNSVNEVIYTISAEGLITSLNPAFEAQSGWRCEELIGRNFLDLVCPSEHELALTYHRRLIQGEKLGRFELQILNKSGDYRQTEFSVTAIHDKHSRVIGTLGVARDVAENHRLK
jgi:PAS domain S-box-containing protein